MKYCVPRNRKHICNQYAYTEGICLYLSFDQKEIMTFLEIFQISEKLCQVEFLGSWVIQKKRLAVNKVYFREYIKGGGKPHKVYASWTNWVGRNYWKQIVLENLQCSYPKSYKRL